MPARLRPICVLWLFAPMALRAWDYPGHRIINQLALASLPADFPGWVREPANVERIAYLAGEPDRWRDSRNEPFLGSSGMDHYLAIEQLADAGIDVSTLTPFRYTFASQFSAGRAAHADRFPRIDPRKDRDHSREWPGFLPWAIAENYAKLQSEFSCLKTFERYGSGDEVANARANVVFAMGVMGHFVGDGSQPLHVTIHNHGWIGPNPHHYSTNFGFHSWIDGGFIEKAGIVEAELEPEVVPARPLNVKPRADGRDPVFVDIVEYLLASQRKVEPLYRLEKERKLEDGGPGSLEGREFIEGLLLDGAETLGAIWLTAWRQAAPDTYLQAALIKRAQPASAR